MSRLYSVPASHRHRHRHALSHSLRPDPSPFSSHGAEIIACSHRARMAAAMWGQISANKGWKLCIQDTLISPTIKKGVEKKRAEQCHQVCFLIVKKKSRPAGTHTLLAPLESKLSACRSTEPCRPSAAQRAYTSSRTLMLTSPQPCEHNMCNGPRMRRRPADGGLG